LLSVESQGPQLVLRVPGSTKWKGQPIEPSHPPQAHEPVGEALRPLEVLDPQERVVLFGVPNTVPRELAGQPLVAIHVDLELHREPRLEPHVDEPKVPVHVLVLSERHLRRILAGYFTYYHRARTHLSPEKDAPDVRPIERPARGPIGKFPKSVACIIDMSGGRRKPASSGRPIATSATAVIVLPSGHRPSDPEVQVSCKSGLWPEEGDGPTLGQPPTGLLAGSSHAREYSPGDSDALLAKDRVCHVC
jgi:hypothetical protein